MVSIIDEARCIEIIAWSEDRVLNTLWFYIGQDLSNFSEQREAFLWLLARLLREGCLKLAYGG